MFHLFLPCNPVPASRPRVTRWGTFYGKRHSAFRSEVSTLLVNMRDSGTLPDPLLSGRLIAWVLFEVQRPKTSKLLLPRGDIDNYSKILFDCCTKAIWEDDVQIEIMSARKIWSNGDGKINLWVKGITDETES